MAKLTQKVEDETILYCPKCKRKLEVKGMNFECQTLCFCKKCNVKMRITLDAT
jgi:uncharacterized protein YbaR (Trm112 family)